MPFFSVSQGLFLRMSHPAARVYIYMRGIIGDVISTFSWIVIIFFFYINLKTININLDHFLKESIRPIAFMSANRKLEPYNLATETPFASSFSCDDHLAHTPVHEQLLL